MSVLSFWSDPIWKGLRIVSFASAAATLIILAVVISGGRSWRVALDTSVVTNIAVFAALVVRSFIFRAKLRHTTKP